MAMRPLARRRRLLQKWMLLFTVSIMLSCSSSKGSQDAGAATDAKATSDAADVADAATSTDAATAADAVAMADASSGDAMADASSGDAMGCNYDDLNACGNDPKLWCYEGSCVSCSTGFFNCNHTKGCECTNGGCNGTTCEGNCSGGEC